MRKEDILTAILAALIAFLFYVSYLALCSREQTEMQTVSPRFQLAEVEPCID